MESNLIFSESQKINESVRNGKVLIGSINEDNKPNFMTIGWGMIGNIWYMPVFITYIRPSRYTYKNIMNNPNFTVNVFLDDLHQNILDKCGSISFYKKNKIQEFDIEYEFNSNKIPYHPDSDIILDCRVVYKEDLNKYEINKEVKNKYYSNNDYHKAFYGKILEYRSKNG
ncbi:MAG: hypothetical protein FXF47_05190 [Candidatus Mcinerneyibacterium aminivorans]|jgi:flavin reductase (DIM6/NTAB) family NADH-FMN oxidoreductase RutF|uniref:Flavin reductase like domain-containing protein n=1 Tax=Candidatus Mcinerneyibacterium aminivorans TaxID=2703815 RepID=A0A5D0ML07_9BACT|nr:MAG: hypothetical protein FXF47_05190 [Candidatus Mcinerneyibacterium aminivorans]